MKLIFVALKNGMGSSSDGENPRARPEFFLEPRPLLKH